MLSKCYQANFSGLTVILTTCSLLSLSACNSEPQISQEAPERAPLSVDLEQTLENYTQLPERVRFQKSIRFHGVVTGARSYDETIFESGKLVELHVKEGQAVTKGQLIAQLYSPDLAEKLTQAQAKLYQAQSQLLLDKEDLQRAKLLFEKSLIAKQELDKAKRNFQHTEQAIAEAKASVSAASNVFADTSIRARESGVISQLYKREGDFINRGDAIFKIDSFEKQRVAFALPEYLAVKVSTGSSHTIYIPATKDAVTGIVTEKSLPTESGVRLHKVTLELPEDSASIIGLRAELDFQHQDIEAFAVDYRAVRYDINNSPFIVVAEQELTPKKISVLDINSLNVILSGDINPLSPIVIGNDVSLPVDFSRL